MAKKAEASKEVVVSERTIRTWIQSATPVAGGQLMVSVPEELVRSGVCRHVRAFQGQHIPLIKQILKVPVGSSPA